MVQGVKQIKWIQKYWELLIQTRDWFFINKAFKKYMRISVDNKGKIECTLFYKFHRVEWLTGK